jgi:hypothetical protein
MKRIITIFTLLVLTHFSVAQLSGLKYIPGSSGPNDYATFSAAITALNGAGVGSGGVTFNVAANFVSVEDCPVLTATGTASNPIVFQKSGSGANPIIKPTGGGGTADAGIIIAGGDYITFNGIDITINSGSAVEFGYLLRSATATDGAQHNTVINCKITLNRANTYSRGVIQRHGQAITNATGANSYNSFQNMIIENVLAGIEIISDANYPDLNNEISYCTVGGASADDIGGSGPLDDYYIAGIEATYCSGISVHHNEIRNIGVSSISNAVGISLDLTRGASYVYNNLVHNIRVVPNNIGLIVVGIRAYCTSTHTIDVYNNMIWGLEHGTLSQNTGYYNIVGMWLNRDGSAGTVNCYYNSVLIEEDQNPTSTGIYAGYGALNLKNNILANFSATGTTSRRYCIYRSGSLSLNDVDYNDYYIASGTNNYVGYSDGNLTTLADWKGSTGKDSHSKDVDPSFFSATNLHTSSAAMNEAGTAIPGITSDIDGDARGNPPDIGADEYFLFYVDMGATALVTPLASGCYTSAETVTVTIKNYSSSAIDFSVYPVTVTTSVTGAVTQSLSATVNTGTLASGATKNVSMSTTLNMTTAGTYTFNASTSATGDANASNNSMAPVTRTVTASTPTPYTQNFDGSTMPPAGWTMTGWIIHQDHANGSTGNGMCCNLWASYPSAQFTLPKLGPVGASDELKFDYRLVNWDGYPANATPNSPAWGTIVIKISSDCGVTFPTFATIDPTNHYSTTNWATMAYSLAGYAGSSIIIRIVCTWSASDYWVDFDNFSIQPVPSCPGPSVQTTPIVSSVGATLGWTGPGSFFDIYIAQTTDAPGSATTPTVEDNPGKVCTWTGGSSSTTYYWWVRNDCAAGGGTGQSTWKGPATFTTLSFRVVSYPWTEGFEHSGNMPEYWNQQWIWGSYSWIITTGGYYGFPLGAHTGTYNARFFMADYDQNTTILITPPLDLSGLTNPVLSFWHTQANNLGGQDELKVHYKTSEGGSWQLLTGQVYTTSIDSWTEEALISLPAPSSTYYIGFEAMADFGYGVCLDDVTVMEAPSCPVPTNQTVTHVTSAGATMGWTGDESFFDVFIDISLTPPDEGTVPTVDDNPGTTLTWTGGALSTTYYWWVRADCDAGGGGGGGQSTWTGPATFTTLPYTVSSFPWSEGFEHSGNMPGFWTQEYLNGSLNWIATTGGFGGYPPGAHTGNYNARFFSDSYSGYTTMLVTPALDLSSLTTPVLSFWHTQAEWAGDQDELRVYYKTSTGGAWTMIPGQEYTTSIANWTEAYEITLPDPSSTYYIGFEGIADWGFGVCMDDVMVMEAPSCPKPPAPVITDITATTVNVDLPGGYDIDSFFDVFYDISPATPSSGGTTLYGIPAQTPSVPLSGLAPLTTYDLYLREDCGFTPSRKLDNFWMEMDDPGNLVTGGGTMDDEGETGEWLEYIHAPGSIDWWNIWFYNGPFVQENIKKIRMGFWVQKLVPSLAGEVYFVINWSTPEWTGPGFPLPGQEQYIRRSPVNYEEVTESGTHYQWIELSYVVSDYNPSWVSVDIWGKNIRIPEGGSATAGLSLSQGSLLYNYWTPGMPGGIIVHECLPEGDQNTTSHWTGPVQFQTIQNLPYCESFSDGWPSFWTQGFAPNVISNSWSISATNAAGGAAYEMKASFQNNAGESWLDSPVIEIPASLAKLSFKYFYEDWGPGVTMYVIYRNSNGSSWTTAWSLVSGNGNAGPETVTVPIALSGDVTIRWYISGNHFQFNYWYIDDVCIIPNCDLANTWTGTLSNSWNQPGNWTCNQVPGPTTKVIIPPKPTGGFFPVIASPSQIEILSLDLMGEAEVIVQTGARLKVLNP